jgi:hypothetical protein
MRVGPAKDSNAKHIYRFNLEEVSIVKCPFIFNNTESESYVTTGGQSASLS